MQWIEEEIQTAIDSWKRENGGEDYWREPLTAVASAVDPLFDRLKSVVDPEHCVPADLVPGAKSVIVFFLPFEHWVGRENDRSGHFAARSWAQAYVTTNKLIAAVNLHLQDRIRKAGYEAATTPATHNFDEKKLISRWSHKHVAYIAGLGTFGANHLFITRAGCCGRLGSVATTMELPPSQRPAGEYCLHKNGQRCLKCISKCVYGALREDSYDRQLCYRQCLENDAHYSDMPLVDVCGKCGANVPCSFKIPVREA
ncbi:MAG: epoxyqueuosine reductase [Syntrophobacteraceae bacterium]